MVTGALILFFFNASSPGYSYAEPCKPRETFRSVLLTDLESQVPASVGTKYRAEAPITHGHEATHAINDRLSKPGHQALYLLNKQYVSFPIPNLKLEDVQKHVPELLQMHRYHTYVVKQSTVRYENINGQTTLIFSHNKNPLYLLNEWVAYNNGAAVGIELAGLGIFPQFCNDLLLAPLEMSSYVLALCCAIKEKDPTYWRNAADFKIFVKNELKRAFKLYADGQKFEKFQWKNDIARDLRKSPQLRAMMQELGVD